MPVVRRTEAMTDEDRAAIRARPSSPPIALPSVARPLAVCALGFVAMLSSPILITRDSHIAVLGPLALVGGLIATVVGGSRFFRAASIRGASDEASSRSTATQAALALGTVHVVELTAEAAWKAQELDDDSDAILLRVDPHRFVYINSQWLYEVYMDEDGTRIPQRLIIRSVDNAGTLWSVTGGGPELPIRNDLPTLPEWGNKYQDKLSNSVDWTSDFAELDEDQLPDDWIPIVRRL